MNCRLKPATQSERRVRVGNLFLLGVKGAADFSCARTALASLSCADWESMLLRVHAVYGDSRNNSVRSSSKALSSLGNRALHM